MLSCCVLRRVLVQLCECVSVQEQEDVKLPLKLLLQLLQARDAPRRTRHACKVSELPSVDGTSTAAAAAADDDAEGQDEEAADATDVEEGAAAAAAADGQPAEDGDQQEQDQQQEEEEDDLMAAADVHLLLLLAFLGLELKLPQARCVSFCRTVYFFLLSFLLLSSFLVASSFLLRFFPATQLPQRGFAQTPRSVCVVGTFRQFSTVL